MFTLFAFSCKSLLWPPFFPGLNGRTGFLPRRQQSDFLTHCLAHFMSLVLVSFSPTNKINLICRKECFGEKNIICVSTQLQAIAAVALWPSTVYLNYLLYLCYTQNLRHRGDCKEKIDASKNSHNVSLRKVRLLAVSATFGFSEILISDFTQCQPALSLTI